MYRRLNDLRFLRVAALLEKTLETYEDYLRALIPHAIVRNRLAPVFEEGPGHTELNKQLRRLEEEAHAIEARVEPIEALQAMLDCEDFARDYYLSNLDRLNDPRLIRLFESLADEERQHADHVRQAMALLSRIRTSP